MNFERINYTLPYISISIIYMVYRIMSSIIIIIIIILKSEKIHVGDRERRLKNLPDRISD